jgi:hypothetical protein
VPLRYPIDLAWTVASHGWASLAPWRWDPDAGILERKEQVDGSVGRIAISQSKPAEITITWEGWGPSVEPVVVRRVRRWLSVDWDPTAGIAALGEYGELIRRGGGRLLRCSSFYEDFVKTVLTINTAWSATCRMAAAIVSEPGGGAFPLPQAILDYGEVRLRERAKLGFRAATILSATQRMLDDGVMDQNGEGRPDYEYLIGLRGIGPYAAAHSRLLLHDFTRIPVDSIAIAYLRDRYASDPATFAASNGGWGAYLALGYRLARLSEKLGLSPA